MPVPVVGQCFGALHEDAKGCFLYTEQEKENDNYAARIYDLCLKRKYCDEIINQYKKIPGVQSGEKGAAGNQILVHELLETCEQWQNKFCHPTFYKLARLDKDVVRFIPEVTALENRIKLEQVTSPIKPEIVVTQSAKELTHVPSHRAVLDGLVRCLDVAGCKRIAVYGAPQAGKTNILKNLNNLLVSCPRDLKFDYVIWVAFPTDLPKPDDIINNIQEKILQRLNLSVQTNGSGKKEVISRALRNKSYLLLFDGFSSSIELEDIGISEEHDHGKVIIEAKDPHLLRSFNFHEKVPLEKLPPEDSRKLFDKIIADETFCKDNSDLGDLILKELGGLPGVIAYIAGQLKSNKRVRYWDIVKQRLKADIWDNDLLEGVKSAFDTAYSKLKENDRRCILYAALFPKEFPIPIDILVECWNAEGFLRCPIPTISYARGEGEYVHNRLIELHLLERCSEHHVRMPINYRRIALETPFPGEKNATSFVRSGPEVDGHLKDEEWEMARRVSLMRSELEELPVSPKCKIISTLFLQLNPNLRTIRGPFFTSMKTLRVLGLHSTGIKFLPASISNLKALRSLYLNNCFGLTRLPHKIVQLKELEVLDIRFTSIHCFLNEISSLVGLRCLRFSFAPKVAGSQIYPTTGRRAIFPPGIADQLSKLEEMTIVIIDGSVEEIDQIRTEVGEFKNFSPGPILIRHWSQDRGNLVQQNGEAITLPNPSVPGAPVQDPRIGIQLLRSDNEHTANGTKNASGDNINDKEKEKGTAEITSAIGSTFGASYGVGSGLGKRKDLSSSSETSLVDNEGKGITSGDDRRKRVVRGTGGIRGEDDPLGLDGLSFTSEASVTRGRRKSLEISNKHPRPTNRKGAPHQPTYRSAAFTQPTVQRPNQNTNQAVAQQYSCPTTFPKYPYAIKLCDLPTNQSTNPHSTQSSESGASI